ncbi:hypothetical protein AAHB36_09905 [Bacillus velezensis]
MDPKFAKIASELIEEYMPTIEKIKGQTTYHIYEAMIKLNAEMLAKALEKYEKASKKLSEFDSRFMRNFCFAVTLYAKKQALSQSGGRFFYWRDFIEEFSNAGYTLQGSGFGQNYTDS